MIKYPNRISFSDDQIQKNVIFKFGYQRPVVEINYPFTYNNGNNNKLVPNTLSPTTLSPRMVAGHFVPLPMFNNILLDENNLPYISS